MTNSVSCRVLCANQVRIMIFLLILRECETRKIIRSPGLCVENENYL